MRKILSLLLTLALVITSVSVLCIMTSAEDKNYTVYETTSIDGDANVTLGSNFMLSGTAYVINSAGVGSEIVKAPNGGTGTAWLINNSYKSNHLVPCRFDNMIGGTVIYQMTPYLSANQIVLCTTDGDKYGNNPITAFEVYVGNDRNNLCVAENMVASHTRVDTSAIHYVINLDEGVSGKYLGIKVLDTLNSAKTSSAWFVKISAYGTNATAFENLYGGTAASDTTAFNYPKKVSLNFGQNPIELISTEAGTVVENPTATSKAGHYLLEWTDGNFDNDIAGSQYYFGKDINGIKVTYDLKDTFSIENVLLSTGQHNAPYSIEWKLYISDSKDDLYTEANCYAFVEDPVVGGVKNIEKLHYVTLDEAVEGRYVGIEHIKDASGFYPFYVNEIAIYGTDTWTTETDFQLSAITNTNLLTGADLYLRGADKAPNLNVNTDLSLTGGFYPTAYAGTDVTLLTDNSLAKEESVFTGYTDKYFNSYYNVCYRTGKMVFDLGEGNSKTVGSVCVDSYTHKYTYRAYVSDDVETLFDNENLLAICDDNAVKTGYAIADAAHQKTGRYMGILITGGTTTALKVREVAFYAPDKAKLTTETNVTAEALNAGKELFVGANAVAGTTAATKDANNQPVSKLTNGYQLDQSNLNHGGHGLIFWNGGHNMTYDLGEAADISKILISGGKKSSGDNTMALKCYGVYMSNDKSTLYNIENQVAFLYNEDYTQTHVFDTSAIDGNYRYVGFRIYVKYAHYRNETEETPVTYIYLSEFGIYGNYPTDAYTVVGNPTDADIAGLGSNGLSSATLDNTYIDNAVITDGEIYTADAVNITTALNASTKLTYSLACEQTVNAVLVGGAYATETVTAPLYYKVYASNSEDTLFDSELVEYYVLDVDTAAGSNGGAVKLFKLATPVTAKYIGIEFITGADTKTLSLSELAVYSTVELELDSAAQITDANDIESIYVDGAEAGSSVQLGTDILSGNSVIVVYGKNGNSDVYFSANGTITLKEELKNALTTSFELRTDVPTAIRFVTEVTLAAKAEADEMGTVVAKWQDLNGATLLRGATDYKNADAVAFVSGTTDIKCGDDTAEASHFSMALHNITQKKYLNNYVVRPYITVSEGDTVYTVYGKTVMVTPLDVAENIKANAANEADAAVAWADEVIAGADIVSVNEAYATSYNITADMLSKAVVTETPDNSAYTPNLARLKKLIEKAQRGEDLVIGTIGGSITRGAYADPIDINCYANLVREWFANTFGVNVTLVNAGVSSTHTGLGVYRLQKEILDKNPDLVIIEYAVNENITSVDQANFATYEAMVRKVLSHNDDVALMEMFMIKYKNNSDATALEFYNAQDMQSKIGGHYGVPMISFYDAVIDTITADQVDMGITEGEYWNLIMADGIHPNNYGHKIAATLITNYIAGVVAKVDSITDTVSALPEIIEGSAAGAYTGTSTLYSSATLPSEYVVSYGSYAPIHNAESAHGVANIFNDSWYAENKAGETMEPMILNIPSGKTVSILLWRKKDVNGVGAMCYVENSTGTTTKGLQNYINSSAYADAIFCYTNETAQPLKVTLAPLGDAAGEWSLIAGIMITE
ncbi:MAG: SGNH/GDSL hydrolase family protein [Clostridia bacterium]|nr:SGNH/GDSL hydrolase family protein [Clostridia bacterium]